jgi:hypothetical protein
MFEHVILHSFFSPDCRRGQKKRPRSRQKLSAKRRDPQAGPKKVDHAALFRVTGTGSYNIKLREARKVQKAHKV